MENIKMKLAIIALTRGGCRTARRYGDLLPEADIYLKREAAEMDPRQQTRRDEHHFECRLAEPIGRATIVVFTVLGVKHSEF